MIDTNKLKSQITEEEWKLRLDLAATYRLIALYGWDDLIYTHVSLRIPGPEHHFLINPYGLMFDEINASSLVKSDLNATRDRGIGSSCISCIKSSAKRNNYGWSCDNNNCHCSWLYQATILRYVACSASKQTGALHYSFSKW